jgi:hypothetical protein
MNKKTSQKVLKRLMSQTAGKIKWLIHSKVIDFYTKG